MWAKVIGAARSLPKISSSLKPNHNGEIVQMPDTQVTNSDRDRIQKSKDCETQDVP